MTELKQTNNQSKSISFGDFNKNCFRDFIKFRQWRLWNLALFQVVHLTRFELSLEIGTSTCLQFLAGLALKNYAFLADEGWQKMKMAAESIKNFEVRPWLPFPNKTFYMLTTFTVSLWYWKLANVSSIFS